MAWISVKVKKDVFSDAVPCPSVRTYETNPFRLNGFSWNPILGGLTKIFRQFKILVQIGQFVFVCESGRVRNLQVTYLVTQVKVQRLNSGESTRSVTLLVHLETSSGSKTRMVSNVRGNPKNSNLVTNSYKWTSFCLLFPPVMQGHCRLFF